MKQLLSVAALAALVVGAAAPALAASCPKSMKKIDAALAANPQLSAADMTQVTKLRSEGAAQHKAGSHKASIDTLGQALAILGIM